MKIIKLVALILLNTYFYDLSYANDAQDVFYQAFNFAQKESPLSQQINWNTIEKNALEFIGDKEITCRGTSAIANILAPALYKYDFHSFVTENGLGSELCPKYQSGEMSQYWYDFMQVNDDTRAFIEEKIQHFWGQRFGDIAYIYVPSGFAYSKKEIRARIIEGRRVVNSLDLDNAKGIIIDFRLNSGGNYLPMLMSITKIIKPGNLLGFSDGEIISLSEDGNTLTTTEPDGAEEILHRIDYLPSINRITLPMIVLIDEGTASSGAITAFALKESSSESLLLGERTSPTLSVNASFELKDGNYFNLMILRLLSPNGKEQPLYLDVDKKLEHNFYSMFKPEDQSVKLAIQLLEQWTTK